MLNLHAASLEGNYWNDPTQRDLWLHTPKGLDDSQEAPLLIMLSGFAGTGEGMLARSLTSFSFTQRLDRWIQEQQCPSFEPYFPTV